MGWQNIALNYGEKKAKNIFLALTKTNLCVRTKGSQKLFTLPFVIIITTQQQSQQLFLGAKSNIWQNELKVKQRIVQGPLNCDYVNLVEHIFHELQKISWLP